MKNLIVILFSIFQIRAIAQENIQWSSSILECSQSYSTEDYSNKKILGAPDVYLEHPRASSNSYLFGYREKEDDESSEDAFIKVAFNNPQKANRIVIAENANPGTITKAFVYDEEGNEYEVFNEELKKVNDPKRLFQITFPFTAYKISAVKIVGQPSQVSGWNGIDGIGIMDSAQPYFMDWVTENVGPKVNSELPELAPKISADGLKLYISKEAHPSNIGINRLEDDLDIWVSDLVDGNWSEAVNIGKPINNETYNWVISVSPDGNTLVVSGKYKSDGTRDGGGISVTKRTPDGRWNIPKRIEIKNYENKSNTADFFITNDQKILLLAIKTKGTRGEHDIYVSFRQSDGEFSTPKNLGKTINTKDDDVAPFLASDGKTMYYSTDGYPGQGNNDIFVTKRLDDTWENWSQPVNMGSSINSENYDSDFTISAKGDFAYMVSHTDSYGESDIIKVKLKNESRPEPVVLIYGKVYNSKTNETLGADILYGLLPEGTEIGLANSDPSDGSYKIVLPYGQLYSFQASASGFYAVTENIDLNSLSEYQEIERDLFLAPIEVGQVVRLNNIFFEFGKAALLEDSFIELNRLVELLEDNANMKVEIAGHTDNVGSDEANKKLSQDRVNSVVSFLTSKGINATRLQAVGYGESSPIATNETEEGRAYNRRVEFKILSK
jgi:outer membrane protein OmpA-like peptidoglycan-associated protein